MNELKRLFSNKDFLCDLVEDHLDEFKGLKHEEIMNCFIGEVQVEKKPVYLPFHEQNDEFKYGIYFKMISPKLDYYHEIICVLEFREKEDVLKSGEMPACAGLSFLLLLQAKEENEGKNISERCYGFYFYTDSDNELKGTRNRYNINIRRNKENLLENNCCSGIEVFL